MFIDGKLITAGEAQRLHDGLFGVRDYEPERCWNGFTLFSPCYGYTEYLIDMRGLVVHRWPVTHTNVAEILPNGNLFTHNDGAWLEEIAPDGKTLWRWDGDPSLDMNTHHDFCVGGDEITFLARVKEPTRPGYYEPGLAPDDMYTDVVWRVNRAGDVVWKFSLGEHIEELSERAGLPLPVPYRWSRHAGGDPEPWAPADWAHANTVEVLPDTPLGRADSRFRAGNILVSLRALDTIAIIDPEKNEIVWAWGLGLIDGQHQPTMLESGNILLFDNGSWRGNSIVLEIDPLEEAVVWEYENGSEFFSPFRSGAQRLPNGNTLVTECDAGRLFEVTHEGEVVWDFWSPFVAQGDNHLGKRIHRSTRYTAEYVVPLFEARDDRIIGEVDDAGEPTRTYAELVALYTTH